MTTTAHEFTPDQIEASIARAIHDRELAVVPSLIRLLAVQAPDRARLIMDTMKVGIAINRAINRERTP